MSKEVVQTKTHDFDQMLLSQARQATHPAAIGPLIRMAKQAGAKGTVRALQRVEKTLAKQVRTAERAEAKSRRREAEKAARADRRKRAKAAAKGRAYVEPRVDSAGVAINCTNSSVLMDDGSVVAWDDSPKNYSIRHD